VGKLLIVVISGLSGSGKSVAIKCFEDLGFYCVDNLPSALVPTFIELCSQSGEHIRKIALGIDIRERDFLEEFLTVFDRLKGQACVVEMVYLEARDEVLLRRFSETRRPHPLAKRKSVLDGIQIEKATLAPLRSRAKRIINTSDFSVHQLKNLLSKYYLGSNEAKSLHITLIAFGYKFGIPYESELLFDLRCLQNPNFIPEIRDLTGNDPQVVDYIMKFPETIQFYNKLLEFIDFLIPFYEKEGRSYMTISLGCTGGRHRSVAFVNQVGRELEKKGYDTTVRYRDIQR